MTARHSTTEPNPARDFDPAALDLLLRGLDHYGLDLSAEQIGQLTGHLTLLEKWNRRLNLTAIVSPAEMVVQHVLDSLALVAHLAESPGDDGRILDIGTGGGFPGVPLAVALPDCHVGLLDSRGKRIEFLRHACATLGLGNIELVKSRVEDYRPTVKFDTLVTRAFSSLKDMLGWTAALQQPGVRMLAMKGKHPAVEIEALPKLWRAQVDVTPLNVPFLDAERHLVTILFPLDFVSTSGSGH